MFSSLVDSTSQAKQAEDTGNCWMACYRILSVKAWDPLVFVTVPAILIVVAAAAIWLPAVRASRVDPVRSLRYE
jgi:ABC-type lipoprotein release transport system permease subunit